MDNLRVILIIAAVCVVAAIYFWEKIQSRKQARRQTVNATYSERQDPGLVISANPNEDELAAGLEELDAFFIDNEPDLDENAVGEIFISRDPSKQPVRRPISESLVIPEQADAFSRQQAGSNTEDINPDSVITLFIVVPEDRTMSGPDIQTALAALGFEFGEMNIFHHYGAGEVASAKPVFSLVNMFEPGYFDIERLDSFTTRGLSVFTRLPMQHNAEIVFSYMLEITRRLASRLGAGILGPDRKPLDQTTINNINRRIQEYDR